MIDRRLIGLLKNKDIDLDGLCDAVAGSIDVIMELQDEIRKQQEQMAALTRAIEELSKKIK